MQRMTSSTGQTADATRGGDGPNGHARELGSDPANGPDIADSELAALRATLARLTHLASLRDVAGLIAHEISQPLGAMLLHASACQRWLDQDPPRIVEARAAAERIVRDGQRARTVVEGVRGLTPECEPEPAPVDLNEIIGVALDLARSELIERAVDVRFVRAALPGADCDRAQVIHVMLSLISNAAQAMARVEAPRLEIAAAVDAEEGIVVTIRDNGEGIDSLAANRIFTPLFTTRPGALGLGLSSCRRFVEAHGGRLWMTPNDEAGVTFSFSVPIRSPGRCQARGT
jgi:signal transduction histidine kinase